MLENWYMYQTPDSKELIPELSLGNTGNTKICLMGRYMFVCLCCCFTSQSGWLKVSVNNFWSGPDAAWVFPVLSGSNIMKIPLCEK